MPGKNLKTDTAERSAVLLADEIKTFVKKSPFNRMPTPEKDTIFDEPLVQFANGDDPIFKEYKKIIGEIHLTPREALTLAYDKSTADLPRNISVISWILPITEKTRLTNRAEARVPSRLWSHTRWFGEKMNDALRAHVVEFLKSRGYLAAAPALPSSLKFFNNERGMYSNWSERHIAYAAGLGTFSLSDGFITGKGIAHRCGSVVTDMALPASRREATGPYTNCLFYVDGTCGVCIKRCPVGAITEKGHDKIKCQRYLKELGYDMDLPIGVYDIEKSVVGCGLCQTKVPCEAVNPTLKA
jgi:epoxyqueuosine reductase